MLLSLDIEITIDTFGRSSLEISRTLMFWKTFSTNFFLNLRAADLTYSQIFIVDQEKYFRAHVNFFHLYFALIYT